MDIQQGIWEVYNKEHQHRGQHSQRAINPRNKAVHISAVRTTLIVFDRRKLATPFFRSLETVYALHAEERLLGGLEVNMQKWIDETNL
ncbi:hypothetical protein LTR56_003046 [Elasticomyces elasticus]|nr:hypothetical protein LTR56_003046 [Elasticomyces elasticus]KAK3662108.1 hypothetical protein LTR22_007081 [Elasticomyces elasticus]KAK4927529.1 hypothetical protein LTR49_005669 [Elasticomyces elasticus]KAK5743697.1 hypothetical protein LTS12_023778 [Elasticomyces elasticus]